MKLEIDIKDYLTDEEIKEIVRDGFKYQINRRLDSETEIERILGNLSYELVWQMVDEVIGKSGEKIIKQKVTDIINNLTEFSVFREKNDYSRKENSIGTKILDKAVEDNQHIIIEKIKKYMENIEVEDENYFFDKIIKEALIKKITG